MFTGTPEFSETFGGTLAYGKRCVAPWRCSNVRWSLGFVWWPLVGSRGHGVPLVSTGTLVLAKRFAGCLAFAL